MKPPARLRRLLMSICFWASVLTALTWVGSGWWFITWQGPDGWTAGVGRGRFGFGRVKLPAPYIAPPGWYFDRDSGPAPGGAAPIWEWRAKWAAPHPPNFHTLTPLWMMFVATAAPAFVLWRSHGRAARRVRQGRCVACGYDRRGLSSPSAACPECGSPTK